MESATPETPQAPPRARRFWKVRRIAGVVVLAVLLLFYYFVVAQPMGSGPAGPAAPEGPFKAAWSERPVLLIGIGDSVTEGYGASPGKSYFWRLAENPKDEFPDMRGKCLSAVLPKLRLENRAVSGSTSLQHAKWQVENLPTRPREWFGIVVMTTGGNDLIHDYGRSPPVEGAMFGATLDQARPWIANYETRLDGMMERISASFPGGCEIFLANIYDPTDGLGSARAAGLPSWPDAMKVLAEYNAVIARVAARRPNVHLVDFHSLFMGHGLTCKMFWRKCYRSDDAHYWYGGVFEDPNDRGYDAARRAFLLQMIETFQKRPIPAPPH